MQHCIEIVSRLYAASFCEEYMPLQCTYKFTCFISDKSKYMQQNCSSNPFTRKRHFQRPVAHVWWSYGKNNRLDWKIDTGIMKTSMGVIGNLHLTLYTRVTQILVY